MDETTEVTFETIAAAWLSLPRPEATPDEPFPEPDESVLKKTLWANLTWPSPGQRWWFRACRAWVRGGPGPQKDNVEESIEQLLGRFDAARRHVAQAHVHAARMIRTGSEIFPSESTTERGNNEVGERSASQRLDAMTGDVARSLFISGWRAVAHLNAATGTAEPPDSVPERICNRGPTALREEWTRGGGRPAGRVLLDGAMRRLSEEVIAATPESEKQETRKNLALLWDLAMELPPEDQGGGAPRAASERLDCNALLLIESESREGGVASLRLERVEEGGARVLYRHPAFAFLHRDEKFRESEDAATSAIMSVWSNENWDIRWQIEPRQGGTIVSLRDGSLGGMLAVGMAKLLAS